MHWVALRTRDGRRRGLTIDAAAEALRWAADTLGQRTVRPAEYERAAGPARAAGQRAHRHGRAASFLLPTPAQIEHAVGWDAALAHAELDPRTHPGGRGGVPIAHALDVFLRENGYLVGKETLKRWAREHGISLANEPHRQAIARLRADRAALGLWTPPQILPARQRPSSVSEEANGRTTLAGPRRRSRRWTIETIRAGLTLAVPEAHRRGYRRLTQDSLKEIAKDLDGVPSWSSVERAAKAHGMRGGQLLAEAERLADAARVVASA